MWLILLLLASPVQAGDSTITLRLSAGYAEEAIVGTWTGERANFVTGLDLRYERKRLRLGLDLWARHGQKLIHDTAGAAGTELQTFAGGWEAAYHLGRGVWLEGRHFSDHTTQAPGVAGPFGDVQQRTRIVLAKEWVLR